MIRWDVSTDKFELGQWFNGKVHEDKCDLSPDGKLLAYIAAKPHKFLEQSEMGYYDAWTAVSRPPYFTALALWSDCGGAFFSTNVQLYVHGSGVSKHHPNHPPTGLEISMDAKRFFERQTGWSLWRIRAERDGWQITPGAKAAAHKKDRLGQYVLSRSLVERSNSFGDAPSYDLPQFDNYSVSSNEKDLLLINNATWADWDQRNRLVYAIGGKLFACEVTRREIKPPRIIAEFNEMEPESIAPPDWASHW